MREDRAADGIVLAVVIGTVFWVVALLIAGRAAATTCVGTGADRTCPTTTTVQETTTAVVETTTTEPVTTTGATSTTVQVTTTVPVTKPPTTTPDTLPPTGLTGAHIIAGWVAVVFIVLGVGALTVNRRTER
jgi:hypothetical protein